MKPPPSRRKSRPRVRATQSGAAVEAVHWVATSTGGDRYDPLSFGCCADEVQIPPPKLPLNICQTPAKMSKKAKNRPTFAAMSVDRPMFPVIAHTMARKTRPPSSGYPGYQVEEHQGHIDVGKLPGQTQQGLHAGNQWLRRVESDC